eukprot:s158_g8.t2
MQLGAAMAEDMQTQALLQSHRVERESDGTYICRLCGKRPRGLDQALAHLESAAHHAKLSQHRVEWQLPGELDREIQSVAARLTTPQEREVSPIRSLTFCTACVRRSRQLCSILLPNVVTLADSANKVSTRLRWCIVLAEDGSERQSLQRLYTVLGLQGTEELDVRVCFADIHQTGGYFHASLAKNTSHRFGLQCIDAQDADLRDHVLVNLDCDIVLPPRFAELVLSRFTARTLQLLGCRANQSATTGRLAIRASAFMEINGYDQEPGILGSGFQDIDLRDRVGIVPFADDGSIVCEGQSDVVPAKRGVIASLLDEHQATHPAVAGWALPNTLHEYATAEDDRRLAKIRWVHNPRSLSWDDMNESNRVAMLAKRNQPAPRAWKRNLQFSQLGWPSVELRRENLQLAIRNPGRIFDAIRPLVHRPPASIGPPLCAEAADDDRYLHLLCIYPFDYLQDPCDAGSRQEGMCLDGQRSVVSRLRTQDYFLHVISGGYDLHREPKERCGAGCTQAGERMVYGVPGGQADKTLWWLLLREMSLIVEKRVGRGSSAREWQVRHPLCSAGQLGSLLKYDRFDIVRATFVVVDEADQLLTEEDRHGTSSTNSPLEISKAHTRKEKQMTLFTATWEEKDMKDRLKQGIPGRGLQVRVGGPDVTACMAACQISGAEGRLTKSHVRPGGSLWKCEMKPWLGESREVERHAKTKESNAMGKVLIFLNAPGDAAGNVKRLVDVINAAILQEGEDKDCARRRVLISTDLVSRGFDRPRCGYVINYDMPDGKNASLNYIHRIGRTGRGGRQGFALTLLDEPDLRFAQQLHIMLQKSKSAHIPRWLIRVANGSVGRSETRGGTLICRNPLLKDLKTLPALASAHIAASSAIPITPSVQLLNSRAGDMGDFITRSCWNSAHPKSTPQNVSKNFTWPACKGSARRHGGPAACVLARQRQRVQSTE